jgi:molybdopterin-guanine dinucleotide biosynthesis protein A
MENKDEGYFTFSCKAGFMAIISGTMIRQKTDNISGVILVGGSNSRFGRKNKANTIIGGEKIITTILSILRDIFEEIIIVTNTPGEYTSLSGLKITGDHFPGVGPLGGIHAAMKTSSKEAVFIFACDMPYLNKDLIISQIEFYYSNTSETVVPEVNGYLEPLHSIYKTSLAERLEEYLSSHKEYAVRDFLKTTDFSFFKLNPSDEFRKAFTNLNTPFF